MDASPTSLILQNALKNQSENTENMNKPVITRSKPIRLAQLLDALTYSPSPEKKIRKQLWTTEKNPSNAKRRGTILKANKENVRKTVHANLNTKKTNAVNQTPLIDLEKFEANPKKFQKVFTSPKGKAKVADASRKTVSNINFAKPVAKPATKQVIIPKIIIDPPPVHPRKEAISKMNNKSQNEILEEILTMLKKVDERLIETVTRIENLEMCFKEHICCMCEKTKNNKTEEKVLIKEPKNDKTMTNAKSEIGNDFLKSDLNISNGIFEQNPIIEKKVEEGIKDELISLQKSLSTNIFSELKETEIPDNELISLQTLSKNVISEEKETEIQDNELISVQKTLSKDVISAAKETEISDNELISVQNIYSGAKQTENPYSKEVNNENTEILDGDKNTAIESKFELLEEQLKNNLNPSPSISTPKSPFIQPKMENLLRKNIIEETVPETLLNLTGKVKNLEAITYNGLRDQAKFLCTPVVKRTVSCVLTPQPNSIRKIISHKIHEQFLMLNNDDL